MVIPQVTRPDRRSISKARLTVALIASIFLGSLGAVRGQTAPGAPRAATPASAQHGYLAQADVPDATRLIGPPPPPGSGTASGDLATYRATRALEGSSRWALATGDAEFGAAAMMRDVSCVLDVDLGPATAPALFHLLGRVVYDTEAAERPAKSAYGRPRPFVANGGAICVKPEDWLVRSFSYPSGHATFSWTAGLVLAEIAPDRAADILARVRGYGDSRVVCGVHYESDVQAGRLVGAGVFDALQNDRAFKIDLAKARRELAKLRSRVHVHPDAARCKVEADALSTAVW